MQEFRNIALSASAAAFVCSLAISRRNARIAKFGLFTAFGMAAGVGTVSFVAASNVGAMSVPRRNFLIPFSSMLNIGVSHCELPKDSSLRSFSISNAPDQQDAPDKSVMEVTASSFERLVLNNDKDVLVLFYAPWCGYCKRLAPIWDTLGDEMKSNESVVIAQIDMTKNSISVPGVVVQGYPTIYLFKKGSKSAPVEYHGARDVASFKAFLNRHA